MNFCKIINCGFWRVEERCFDITNYMCKRTNSLDSIPELSCIYVNDKGVARNVFKDPTNHREELQIISALLKAKGGKIDDTSITLG